MTRAPLRVMRLARLACQLNFEIELGTAETARAAAPRLTAVSPERVFEELKRLLCADRAPDGVGLLGSLGIAAAVLPELEALDGVDQSRFHHLDVLGHTRQVLAETIRIVDDPEFLCESYNQASALYPLLEAPFANGLTRGQAELVRQPFPLPGVQMDGRLPPEVPPSLADTSAWRTYRPTS